MQYRQAMCRIHTVLLRDYTVHPLKQNFNIGITNFVIPKRDKKTSHFLVYSQCATTIPTILGMVIAEVRTTFAPH